MDGSLTLYAMNKQQTAKLELLKAWAARHGYIEDRFGHFVKTHASGAKYRYKVQSNTVRREVWNVECKTWFRLMAASFVNLNVSDEDKLMGFKK